MGKLIPIRRASPSFAGVTPDSQRSWLLEPELRPPLVLLFLASVLRVGFTVVHHHAFDAEGTLALGCVLGLPWLAWRAFWKRG